MEFTKDRQQAMQTLLRDEVLHIDMLENLRHYGATVVAANDAGVLLWRPDAALYMLSAQDEKTAAALARQAKGPVRAAVAHQPFCVPVLLREWGLVQWMVCTQAAYLDSRMPPEPAGIEVRPLGPDALALVQRHYKAGADDGYILGRIAAGRLFGGYMGGEMAGFVGLHEEGTAGMLEVLPAFRRRGVGRALCRFIYRWMMERGLVPHAHIEADNEASLALQRQMGCVFSPPHIVWMEAPGGGM